MALTKDTAFRLAFDENFNASVARVTRYFDDASGEVENVGERIQRKAYKPGDDISALPPKIRQIITSAWS